jgi:hypothetical protein
MVSRSGAEPELRKIVTEALVGMIAAVTSSTPPADAPLPDFIQAPVDRAATRIAEHFSRLQADNSALKQKLTMANLSCHDLAHKLADKFGSVQGAQFETIKALRYLNEELQQRLTVADQRIDDLEAALKAAQAPFPGYPDRHPYEVAKP